MLFGNLCKAQVYVRWVGGLFNVGFLLVIFFFGRGGHILGFLVEYLGATLR